MLQRDLEGMNTADADGFLDRVRRTNALGRMRTRSVLPVHAECQWDQENSDSCRLAPVMPSKSCPSRKRSTASAIGRSCWVT